MKRHSANPATLAVHAGDRKRTGGFTPVTTPIYAAASYFYDRAEDLEAVFNQEREGQNYSRYGNPTNEGLEEQLRALEGADFATTTASGMAALHMALLAALLDRRKSIVAADVLYGQTLTLLTNILEPLGIQTSFADPCDLASFEDAVKQARPGCILIETISNPLLRAPEIDRIAGIAQRHGALTVVDATFTTPILLRPLDCGADLVVHSATKFMAGHGDVLGGAILGREDMRPLVEFLLKSLGPNLGPFEAYLAMRGVKTLPLRMERQCGNAMEIAQRLAAHDEVQRVYYPGLPDHPDHATAKRLFSPGLFGAMVSFDLAGGRERALAFLDALEMVVPATSLGDVHTMALYPAMSSHREVSPQRRRKLGIGDGLMRLSAGIEASSDILGDLEQALRVSARAAAVTSG